MNHIFTEISSNDEPHQDNDVLEQGWPDDFDFETDEICQSIFKPFIKEQLDILEEYDSKRDLKSDYIFHQHAYDAAQDVKNTCLELGLGQRVANNMYYATLIHDIGKPELPPNIWDYEQSPPKEINEQKRTHVNLGAKIFEQRFKDIDHSFKNLALDIIANHHERMDGQGENKLTAEQLSMPARLVCIVEDYDGRTHLRSHHIEAGMTNDAPSVFEYMEKKMAGAFDPDLYAAFKTMKLEQYQNSLDLNSDADIEPQEPSDLSL